MGLGSVLLVFKKHIRVGHLEVEVAREDRPLALTVRSMKQPSSARL